MGITLSAVITKATHTKSDIAIYYFDNQLCDRAWHSKPLEEGESREFRCINMIYFVFSFQIFQN